MDTFLSRYRSLTTLAVVLVAQVVLLGFQVRRQTEAGPVRLARVWAVSVITPFEKVVVHTEDAITNTWHSYVWVRGLRIENEQLRAENERIRLDEIRLAEDAAQARRLQALLGFKEQFVSQTVAAQVIGSSGSEMSRTLYIDKGIDDGVRADQAVITPDGVIGKVLKVFTAPTARHAAQVLLLTDPSSGVGAILEKSRLQGILKGTSAGELVLQFIMSDEKVESGERVLTSGGDRVFPKGMPIGVVTQVSPGPDMFLNIRVKPSAQISRLEEVLVITKIDEKAPSMADANAAAPTRAADILAQRLPTVKVEAPDETTSKGQIPTMTEWIRQQKLAQQQQKQGTANAAPKTGASSASLAKQGVSTSTTAPKQSGRAASVQNSATPGQKKPAAGAGTSAASPAPKTGATGAASASPKKPAAGAGTAAETPAPKIGASGAASTPAAAQKKPSSGASTAAETPAPKTSAPKAPAKKPQEPPSANPAPATPPGVTLR